MSKLVKMGSLCTLFVASFMTLCGEGNASDARFKIIYNQSCGPNANKALLNVEHATRCLSALQEFTATKNPGIENQIFQTSNALIEKFGWRDLGRPAWVEAIYDKFQDTLVVGVIHFLEKQHQAGKEIELSGGKAIKKPLVHDLEPDVKEFGDKVWRELTPANRKKLEEKVKEFHMQDEFKEVPNALAAYFRGEAARRAGLEAQMKADMPKLVEVK